MLKKRLNCKFWQRTEYYFSNEPSENSRSLPWCVVFSGRVKWGGSRNQKWQWLWGVGLHRVGGEGSSWRTRKWQPLGAGLKVREMTTDAVTRGNKGSFCGGCAGQWQQRRQQQQTRVSLQCQVVISTGRSSGASGRSRGILGAWEGVWARARVPGSLFAHRNEPAEYNRVTYWGRWVHIPEDAHPEGHNCIQQWFSHSFWVSHLLWLCITTHIPVSQWPSRV